MKIIDPENSYESLFAYYKEYIYKTAMKQGKKKGWGGLTALSRKLGYEDSYINVVLASDSMPRLRKVYNKIKEFENGNKLK